MGHLGIPRVPVFSEFVYGLPWRALYFRFEGRDQFAGSGDSTTFGGLYFRMYHLFRFDLRTTYHTRGRVGGLVFFTISDVTNVWGLGAVYHGARLLGG